MSFPVQVGTYSDAIPTTPHAFLYTSKLDSQISYVIRALLTRYVFINKPKCMEIETENSNNFIYSLQRNGVALQNAGILVS